MEIVLSKKNSSWHIVIENDVLQKYILLYNYNIIWFLYYIIDGMLLLTKYISYYFLQFLIDYLIQNCS